MVSLLAVHVERCICIALCTMHGAAALVVQAFDICMLINVD